jgi:hypothetical protein
VALRVSERAKAGQGSDMLVVDAVLHYTRRFAEGDEVMVRFIELDRGTETMQRLTAKLLAYRQLYSYRPKTGASWRDRYLVFPKVLVVLAGRLSASSSAAVPPSCSWQIRPAWPRASRRWSQRCATLSLRARSPPSFGP